MQLTIYSSERGNINSLVCMTTHTDKCYQRIITFIIVVIRVQDDYIQCCTGNWMTWSPPAWLNYAHIACAVIHWMATLFVTIMKLAANIIMWVKLRKSHVLTTSLNKLRTFYSRHNIFRVQKGLRFFAVVVIVCF